MKKVQILDKGSFATEPFVQQYANENLLLHASTFGIDQCTNYLTIMQLQKQKLMKNFEISHDKNQMGQIGIEWKVKQPCLPQYANKLSSPNFVAPLKSVMTSPTLPIFQNDNAPQDCPLQSKLILIKYLALGTRLRHQK